MAGDITDIPPASPPDALPTPRRFRWLLAVAIACAGLLFVSLLALAWVLGSAAGATVVLGAAGLKATGLEGRLAGPLRARTIEYERPGILVQVEGADFDWAPLGLLAGRLQVTYLRAESISVATSPSEKKAAPPMTLEPPLTIRVERAEVKRVRLGTLVGAGKWTPSFEMTQFGLNSVAGGKSWVFDSAGAMTSAGRVDIKGSVGATRPFPLDIEVTLGGEREGRKYGVVAQAKGNLDKFTANLRGTEGGITGEGVAEIETFEAQPVRRVRGKLSGIDLQAFAPAAPQTQIEASVDLAADGANRLAGSVSLVNAQAGPLDAQRLPITQARARLLLAAPRYEMTEAQFGFSGGGKATGEVRLEAKVARAKLDVTGLDLAALHSKLRPTQLAGSIVADGDAKAQKFDVSLKDPRFAITGRAALANEVLVVEEARVVRDASVAKFKGTLALAGRRAFDASGELEHVDLAVFASAPASDLNGSFRTKGTLSPAPVGDVAFELGASKLAGLPLSAQAKLAGTPQRLERGEMKLALGETSFEAQGAYGKPGDGLDFKLASPDLGPLGRVFKHDIAGLLQAEGRFTGTLAEPAGRLAASAERLKLPGGLALAAAKVRLDVGAQADSRVDAVLEGTLLTRAGLARTTTQAESFTVKIAGTRAQHRITLAAVLPPDTRLGPASPGDKSQPLAAALQGGLVEKAASPRWQGRIEQFAIQGANALRLTAPATLTLARDLVEIGDASVKGNWGDARFALTRWTPSRIEARGASQGLITRQVVRALGLPAQPRSNLVLSAEWDVRATETLDGFVRVKRVSGDVRLGDPPLPLDIEEFGLSIEATRGRVNGLFELRGKQVGRISARVETEIRREGATWTLPGQSPLQGEIDVNLPSLRWASEFLGPEARLDGRGLGKVALGGTIGTPTWRGSIAAENVSLKDAGQGFEIDEGHATILLDGREVRIERFELASAWRPTRRAERRLDNVKKPDKGRITASGSLDLASRSGAIVVRVDGYPLTQLPWRFVAASGELKLEAKENALTIAGAFKADAGWFGIAESAPPALSEDVLIDRGEGPPAARERQRIVLDLRIGLGTDMYFSGRGLTTRLAGDIRLRGEPGRSLATVGVIRTDGGTYDAYGQKLSIERGVLTFQGPIDNPSLNVLAVRGGMPVVAGVEVLGTVSRPVVRLYSAPDVPDHEKLSWLVLGRGPAQSSEGDAATLVAAANALLGVTPQNRRLMRSLGFDEMRLGRGDTTSTLGALPQSTVAGKTGAQSGAEVFTVGKRLSKDLYVSYQQSLSDATATLRFTYQVSQKLQLLLNAGDKPGVDAVYRINFN